MKTYTITTYQFNELSEGAKQTAIDNYCNSETYDGNWDEIHAAAEAAANLFGLNQGRTAGDLRSDNIDNCILELSGLRLRTYLLNNYGRSLFKPAYIRCIDGERYLKQFICKHHSGRNGTITFLYSRIRTNNDGVLTGCGYDNDILQPIYDFIDKPTKDTTFEDLIREMGNAIDKCFRDEEEWVNSDEYISDILEVNDYEFYGDGSRY